MHYITVLLDFLEPFCVIFIWCFCFLSIYTTGHIFAKFVFCVFLLILVQQNHRHVHFLLLVLIAWQMLMYYVKYVFDASLHTKSKVVYYLSKNR